MRYPAAKLESLARDFLEATGSSEDDPASSPNT